MADAPQFCPIVEDDYYTSTGALTVNPSGTRMFASMYPSQSTVASSPHDFIRSYDVSNYQVTLEDAEYVPFFTGSGVYTLAAATDDDLWVMRANAPGSVLEFYTVPLTGGGTPTFVDDISSSISYNVWCASETDRVLFALNGGTKVYEVTSGGGVVEVDDLGFAILGLWGGKDLGVLWGVRTADERMFRYEVGGSPVIEDSPGAGLGVIGAHIGVPGNDPDYTDSFWRWDSDPDDSDGYGLMRQFGYDGSTIEQVAAYSDGGPAQDEPPVDGAQPAYNSVPFGFTRGGTLRRWLFEAPYGPPPGYAAPTFGEFKKWGSCGGWVLNRLALGG